MSKIQRGTRYDILLEAALDLSQEVGYRNFKRDDVCDRAQVGKGLVAYHFKNMAGLREKVMKIAVERKIESIVAQGLGAGDPIALEAPQALKKKAAKYLTGVKN